jgi:hypothetical protein
VELSDHRPISSALELLVDPEVHGFQVTSSTSSRTPCCSSNKKCKNDADDQMAAFTFTIIRPCVQFINDQAKAHNTVVIFPLMPEDPFAKERMESSLSEVGR